MFDYVPTISQLAELRGYSPSDVLAGQEFYLRKNGLRNPPGEFDRAGRFTAAERTIAVDEAPAPSTRTPHSELKVAISARHCAELYGAKETHVKHIARAFEYAASTSSVAELLQPTRKLGTILKPVSQIG